MFVSTSVTWVECQCQCQCQCLLYTEKQLSNKCTSDRTTKLDLRHVDMEATVSSAGLRVSSMLSFVLFRVLDMFIFLPGNYPFPVEVAV